MEAMSAGTEGIVVVVAMGRPTRCRALDGIPVSIVDGCCFPEIYARDGTPRHIVICNEAASDDP